jgi:hypothetical protein
MAKQEITCDDILRELKAGQYRPIYYLMGEEPYYIDLISDYITDNVLNETEKEFNLTVVYGADVDVGYNYQCRQTLSHDVRAPSGSSEGSTEHTQYRRAFLLPSKALAIYNIGNMPQTWRIG